MIAAANAVRDQLSSDTWLAVSTIDRELAEIGTRTGDVWEPPDVPAGLDEDGRWPGVTWPRVLATVLRDLLTLAGLTAESMVRDPGWHFLDAGRRLERAIQLARLLDATVVGSRSAAADSLLLESLLVSTESIITYRRRYRSRAQLETVLDLLLLDGTNPRSLRYQLDRLSADLAGIAPPGADADREAGAALIVADLRHRLDLVDTAALAARLDPRGAHRASLSQFVLTMADRLEATAVAIDDAHFDRPDPQRSLVAGQEEWFGDVIAASVP
jgi:uncharacterized alpha-E superfamily protein